MKRIKRCRQKVIKEIAIQGQHRTESIKFFEDLWVAMREEFSEENNTTTAFSILEYFLSVLPIKTINKHALVSAIEERYAIDEPVG